MAGSNKQKLPTMPNLTKHYTNATPIMNWCSFKFKPRTDRKIGDRCPIIIQVFISGKKTVLNTGISVQLNLWDAENQLIKGRTPEVHDANMVLAEAKAAINRIQVEFRLAQKTLTIEAFKDAFLNRATRDCFIIFMLREIEARYHAGTISAGTFKHHRNVCTRLRSHYPTLPFSIITAATLEDYHRYLHKYFTDQDKQAGLPTGYHTNTIHGHFKVIKTYLKIAEQRNIKFQWPFHGFKVSRGSSRIVYLSAAELKSMLTAYTSSAFKGTEHYSLTVFLFACYTSLRISDIIRLSPADVVQDHIVIRPQKTKRTGKVVRIPLNNVSRMLIQHRGDAMFRAITEQKINKHLKTIAAILGITKNISLHVGRHTFATEFLRRGGQVHVLQKIMGHNDIKTTMVYTHLEDQHLTSQMQIMDD
jgi:site-specific recombinase XerD